jgi:predicted CoA-binding protein/RimJ/RimL family protein N-acetyltransferase
MTLTSSVRTDDRSADPGRERPKRPAGDGPIELAPPWPAWSTVWMVDQGSKDEAMASLPYPAHREVDVALRDGSTVHIRPVRPDDRNRILELLQGLSPESRTLRFFTASSNLEWVADRMSEVDYRDRSGLIATAGGGDHVVAHAAYITTRGDRAEIAFAIADVVQGRGLGTILLGQLAEMAHEAGVRLFEAQVLPQNRAMIDVFRESGFPVMLRSEPGVVMVEFPTSITAEALERFERREQTAAEAAMRVFLSPQSVAVIGASRTRGGIAGEVFHNLFASGFNGPVYPVNPGSDVVQSVLAYPSVKDIPGRVDLAVIVVPARLVLEAARDCAQKGVRALVVISSGFAEISEEGRHLQRDLLTI